MNGGERLAAYLASPSEVREAFDRRQARAIECDLAEERRIDEWFAAEIAGDPLVEAAARRRRNDRLIAETVGGGE